TDGPPREPGHWWETSTKRSAPPRGDPTCSSVSRGPSADIQELIGPRDGRVEVVIDHPCLGQECGEGVPDLDFLGAPSAGISRIARGEPCRALLDELRVEIRCHVENRLG